MVLTSTSSLPPPFGVRALVHRGDAQDPGNVWLPSKRNSACGGVGIDSISNPRVSRALQEPLSTLAIVARWESGKAACRRRALRDSRIAHPDGKMNFSRHAGAEAVAGLIVGPACHHPSGAGTLHAAQEVRTESCCVASHWHRECRGAVQFPRFPAPNQSAGLSPVANMPGESKREWGRHGDKTNSSEIRPLINRSDPCARSCSQPCQLFTTDHSRSRPM